MHKQANQTIDRHQPSGLNSEFNYYGYSYLEYMQHMRHVIQLTRQPHAQHSLEFITDANAPFEMRPQQANNAGILMLHGLFDSSFILRDLGRYFCEKGFKVRGMVLPGHGTVPGDLLHTTLEDWISASHFGIQSFANEVDKLFVVGFSTGAALAIYHALHGAPIDGLGLFAPAIGLPPFAFLTSLPLYLKRYCQRCQWYCIGKNQDYAKYDSYAANAAYQVYRLTKTLSKSNPQRIQHIPHHIVITDDDEVVSTPATLKYFKALNGTQHQLLLYSSKTPIASDPRVIVRSSHYPEKNIINYSHVCLLNHQDNFHYGKQGDLYTTLNKERTFNLVYGALPLKKRHHYNLVRLTYNPDFDHMAEMTSDFLKNNSST